MSISKDTSSSIKLRPVFPFSLNLCIILTIYTAVANKKMNVYGTVIREMEGKWSVCFCFCVSWRSTSESGLPNEVSTQGYMHTL